MARIDSFNRSLLHIYGAARECRLDEFYEQALGVARQSLHFDSGAVIKAQAGKNGEIAILAMHNHRQPLEKLHDRKNFTEPDPTLLKAMRQPGKCLGDELTLLDQRKYADVVGYARKYDVAFSLVLVAPALDAHQVDLISLWRAPRSRRYGESGARMGDLLLPHLLMARRINEQLALDEAGASKKSNALVIADRGGCLRYVDRAAIAFLQKEWPQWTPPMLPPTLLKALGRPGTRQWQGRTLRIAAEVHGESLHLLLRDKPDGPRLTPAEQAVAGLAARGLSNKAIATRLGTSPSTVRNQLHHVYVKLGVSGKAALAHRLAGDQG